MRGCVWAYVRRMCGVYVRMHASVCLHMECGYIYVGVYVMGGWYMWVLACRCVQCVFACACACVILIYTLCTQLMSDLQFEISRSVNAIPPLDLKSFIYSVDCATPYTINQPVFDVSLYKMLSRNREEDKIGQA